MAPLDVPEPRCEFCFLPVKNPGDEFCSPTCAQLTAAWEAGETVVYSSVELAASRK